MARSNRNLNFSHKILASAGIVFTLVTAGVVLSLGPISERFLASVYLAGTVGGSTGSSGDDLAAEGRALLTQREAAEINARLHPYSTLASRIFPQWTAGRIRSELTIEDTVASSPTLGAVRVSFSAYKPETALAVATAIASILTQSRNVPQDVPTSDGPRSSTPDSAGLPLDGRASQADVDKQISPSSRTVGAIEAQPSASAAPVRSGGNGGQIEAYASQRGLLLKKRDDLNQQIQTETDDLNAMEAEKQRIQNAANEAGRAERAQARAAQPDPNRAILQSILKTAQKQLAALRERYTEDYPDVVAARERVTQVQSDLERLGPELAAQTPRPVEKKPAVAEQLTQQMTQVDQNEVPIRANIVSLEKEMADNASRLSTLQLKLTRISDADISADLPAPAASLAPSATAPSIAAPRLPLEHAARPQFQALPETEVHEQVVLSPGAVASISIGAGLMAALLYLWIARPRLRQGGLARIQSGDRHRQMLAS